MYTITQTLVKTQADPQTGPVERKDVYCGDKAGRWSGSWLAPGHNDLRIGQVIMGIVVLPSPVPYTLSSKCYTSVTACSTATVALQVVHCPHATPILQPVLQLQ